MRILVSESETVDAATLCLNCGAPLAGAYCAACGQQAVDLASSTWHILTEAVQDATDIDGRTFRTARALASPGRLTIEFLRGRRAPYFSPLKVFLLAGTVLTITWVATRGVDARYYGFGVDRSAGGYIDVVVRGALAGSIAIAVTNWVIGRGRRRLLDESVFALHLVAALALLTAAATWAGTAWKLVWGTAGAVPPHVPSLPWLLFLPAAAAGVGYTAIAVRRVHGGRWWLAILRAVLVAAILAATTTGVILRMG